MAKEFSRRRFMFLGGLGLAGGAVSLPASSHPLARFICDRAAELAKPCCETRYTPRPDTWDSSKITAAYLGHATVLINFQGVNIITDPVLFPRIGANLGFGTLGPIRRQACALPAEALPTIDLALVSHAHLDHLDTRSLGALGGSIQAVTAPHTTDLLVEAGVKKCRELRWGQKTRVNTEHGEIEVEAFQVKHWGARWRHDTHRGYNGYILSRNGKKIIFGGDTALCEGFQEVRGKGPFEFACMPIGAYNPFIQSHCNPEQALQMANEAGARHILPIHYYTFRLGRERSNEPIERLQTALKGEPDRLGWREAGETFVVSA